MANTIFPRENGPYRVDGDIVLVDADGNPIEPPRRPFFLCRCGHSNNKPFCDGTHSKLGFTAPAGMPPRPDPSPEAEPGRTPPPDPLPGPAA